MPPPRCALPTCFRAEVADGFGAACGQPDACPTRPAKRHRAGLGERHHNRPNPLYQNVCSPISSAKAADVRKADRAPHIGSRFTPAWLDPPCSPPSPRRKGLRVPQKRRGSQTAVDHSWPGLIIRALIDRGVGLWYQLPGCRSGETDEMRPTLYFGFGSVTGASEND